MRRHLLRYSMFWSIAMLTAGLLALGSNSVVARQDKSQAKAWLGVAIQDVTEEVAKKNNISDEQGAYVIEVPEESPAESAGIKKGDVITELNKKQIDDAEALISAVQKLKVGDKVDVIVLRKGEKKSFQVVLGKYPRNRQFAVSVRGPGNLGWVFGNRATQGMHLMELSDQLSEYFGVPSGTGILVEKVEKGSAAEKAGIKAGDVLQKIGKRSIDDFEDVSKALARAEEGDKIPVEVIRKGEIKSITLEVQEVEFAPENIFFRNFPDAGMLQIPRREGNLFNHDGGNDKRFRIELNDISPKMDEMKERIQEMKQNLQEHRADLEKSLRMLRVRTV